MYSAFYRAAPGGEVAGARRARSKEGLGASCRAVSVSGSRWRWRSFTAGAADPRRADHRARPRARRALHELVRALRTDGLLDHFNDHYIEEADSCCDRVVVLRDGEVVADGTPSPGAASGGSSRCGCCLGSVRPAPLLEAGPRAGSEGEHHRS